MKTIVTSGGTGGHIYPAVSLIKFLENNGEEVLFVGSNNRMEQEIALKEDINFVGFDFTKRKGIINKVRFTISMIITFFKTIKLLKEYRPDVVIGFGNYISFPVCIAAYLKKIPIILHEQNSVMGKANIILGYFAKKIGYSIPLIKEYHKKKLVNVGNPRSSECLKSTISNYDIDVTRNNILIFMGSLGSSTVNNVLKQFIKENNDKNIYHIVTGKSLYKSFIEEISKRENIKIYSYVDDMISLMKKCDLVVTRSGATTISEILTLGLPSILIPSPFVVNNHQFYNANYLYKNEACEILEEKDLTAETLKNKIDYLLNNSEKRVMLRINSLKLAVFDSNNKIYSIIKDVINE